MNDTPLTNKAQLEFESGHGYPNAVHADFARELERENERLRNSDYQLMLRVRERRPIIFDGGIRYEANDQAQPRAGHP
jgi:hypothetical protein